MNLATLPASIREAVHFTCMTHVCNAILEHITGPNVSGPVRDTAETLLF